MALDVPRVIEALCGDSEDTLPMLPLTPDDGGGSTNPAPMSRVSECAFTGIVLESKDRRVDVSAKVKLDIDDGAVFAVPIGDPDSGNTMTVLDGFLLSHIDAPSGVNVQASDGCIVDGSVGAVTETTYNSFSNLNICVKVDTTTVAPPTGQGQIPLMYDSSGKVQPISSYNPKATFKTISSWVAVQHPKSLNQVTLYLYAPLRATLGVGEHTSETPLHAPRTLVQTGTAVAPCVPLWREEQLELYPGWCSSDVDKDSGQRLNPPMARVVQDCAEAVAAERIAASSAGVTGDGGTSRDGGPAMVWGLVYPITRSLYRPQIRRAPSGHRDPDGGLSADAVYTQGSGGLYDDFMRLIQEDLEMTEQSDTTPNCEGLMGASKLCDCAMLDQPIGAPSDAARGYASYPRVAYFREGRGRLSIDAGRCFVSACQTTDSDARADSSSMRPFGKPPCSVLVQECKSFQSLVGNTFKDGVKQNTIIHMDCPSV